MPARSGVILQPGGLSGRPLLFGEVLCEEFMDGRSQLGGAAFNVARHLHSWGLDPLLVSRVGEDEQGHATLECMLEHGLDTEGIQRDGSLPTGRARVSLLDDEPLVSLPPEQAYDYIDGGALPAVPDGTFALLYHGSLVARQASSAAALEQLRESGLPVFVDLNLRTPWWEPERVESLLGGARWLKLNAAEMTALTEQPARDGEALLRGAATLCNRYGVQTVIVTRGVDGVDGAVAVTADGAVVGKAQPVGAFVDSMGSGDAFSAVTLLGIVRGWSLETTLRRATEFAAAVCEVHGAIPKDETLYRRILESWQSRKPKVANTSC